MVWIALGVVMILLGAVSGAGYWRFSPKQGQAAPEIATSLEAPPTVALLVPPPDEPTIMPVAESAVAAPAAEAAATAPVAPVPQSLATTKPVAPADNVFVVRFDSKLTGLTRSGLRALHGALRAADKGHKVKIEIAGCEDHDNVPTGLDCASLARGLKWILAHRGMNHPADLVASFHPSTIATAGWFVF
jgi:hypothetical protein